MGKGRSNPCVRSPPPHLQAPSIGIRMLYAGVSPSSWLVGSTSVQDRLAFLSAKAPSGTPAVDTWTTTRYRKGSTTPNPAGTPVVIITTFTIPGTCKRTYRLAWRYDTSSSDRAISPWHTPCIFIKIRSNLFALVSKYHQKIGTMCNSLS